MLEKMGKRKSFPQQELATRLVEAMEEANLSQAELARECGVTIQAVHDWRITGRIAKQHLMTICRATKKPLEYFLVGLSRAAVLLLTMLALAAPAPNAQAAIYHNHSLNNDCILMRWLLGWLSKFVRRRALLHMASRNPYTAPA